MKSYINVPEKSAYRPIRTMLEKLARQAQTLTPNRLVVIYHSRQYLGREYANGPWFILTEIQLPWWMLWIPLLWRVDYFHRSWLKVWAERTKDGKLYFVPWHTPSGWYEREKESPEYHSRQGFADLVYSALMTFAGGENNLINGG